MILLQGDSRELLKTLPDCSVDSVVTDPPYHLASQKGGAKGFMGKSWDGGSVAQDPLLWTEVLRVLKPGGLEQESFEIAKARIESVQPSADASDSVEESTKPQTSGALF